VSGYDVVEEVSKVLRKLLTDKMMELGVNASISFIAPGDKFVGTSQHKQRINLYLYHVKESAAFKNLPYMHTSGSSDSLLSYPPLSLSLFYLVTPYYEDETVEDIQLILQRLLGVAMRVMHEYSIVPDVYLAPYKLKDSKEKLKITINPLSFEEISKIWTSLDQSLRLSVSYEVSIVQITSTTLPKLEQRRMPDVVRAEAYPLGGELRIYNILPAEAYLNTTASLFGTGFEGEEEPKVLLDGTELAEQDVTLVSSSQININIAPTTLLGQKEVIVRIGQKSSNPLEFEVIVTIDKIEPSSGPADTNVSIAGTGFIAGQEVRVIIDGTELAPPDITLVNEKQINFKIPAATIMPAGLKKVRVKVGQKESNSLQFEVTTA
jgi:hypothetical protein